MILLPSAFIWLWLLGLLALAIFLTGAWLLWQALRPRKAVVRNERPDGGHEVRLEQHPNPRRWPLLLGIALLLWTFAGSWLVGLNFLSGDDRPRKPRSLAEQRITRPDGTRLHVEIFGPANAPTLVLTHGWSLNGNEWDYVRRQLGDRFRLVTWDLRGLGQSTAPSNNDYALERMAEDLNAVVQSAAGSAPVVLVGHSIGGMINLTYCKLFPERLGQQVRGIAQLNTTYTNPARTAKDAERQIRLQNSIGEPLLHTTAVLSPVLRLLNWVAYRSGVLQIYVSSSSFAGTQTRGQVDYAAGSYAKSSPAVVALGTLAMLHWDASDVLAKVNVPVLIISANHDTTTTPAASEHMQQTMPNAHLIVVQPAAHLGVLERNLEYNRAISEFAAVQLKGLF